MQSPQIPRTMRAAVITRHGGPDVLEITRRPTPVPHESDVLIRVVGSALNRADLVQRAGGYPAPAGAPPDIPGLEFAGVVAARGAAVTRWEVGDRVFGLVPGGAHAEYLVTDPDTIARVPESLDLHTAGTLPEACITAHDALVQAEFQHGESVLIHAVGSGVGLAAVQIVRATGGVPFGTARSPHKLHTAATLGLEKGFVPTLSDDGAPQFAAQILESTGGKGVDIILDLLGGDYVSEGVRSLAQRGRLVLIGVLAGGSTSLDLRRILSRRISLRGTLLRSRSLAERVRYTHAFEKSIVPLLASGTVRAEIERSFDLNEIAAAHSLLESNSTSGKVAIRISPETPA